MALIPTGEQWQPQTEKVTVVTRVLKSAWATGSLVPALISQRVCAAWGLCLISCWGWPPAAGSTPQACFVLQEPPGLLQTGFLAADCMGQCN